MNYTEIKTKIKQFFCKHYDQDTNVDFIMGPFRSVGKTCLTRGFNIEIIVMSCRKCGKELGSHRLYGKYMGTNVDNREYNIYKVTPDPEERIVRNHCAHELLMWIRQGWLTSDRIIAMLRTEGKFPSGQIKVIPYKNIGKRNG